MKTFKNQAAQGDILITRIDTLPDNLEPMPFTERKDDIVCAHSETGHHHVVAQEDVDAYQAANDPFVMYLVVKKETVLKHLRSFDTHESLLIPPGTYRINRQREGGLEQYRQAQD